MPNSRLSHALKLPVGSGSSGGSLKSSKPSSSYPMPKSGRNSRKEAASTLLPDPSDPRCTSVRAQCTDEVRKALRHLRRLSRFMVPVVNRAIPGRRADDEHAPGGVFGKGKQLRFAFGQQVRECPLQGVGVLRIECQKLCDHHRPKWGSREQALHKRAAVVLFVEGNEVRRHDCTRRQSVNRAKNLRFGNRFQVPVSLVCRVKCQSLRKICGHPITEMPTARGKPHAAH